MLEGTQISKSQRGLEGPKFPPGSEILESFKIFSPVDYPNYRSVYKSVFNPDRINFQESLLSHALIIP